MTEIHPVALGFDTCYVPAGSGVVVLDAGQPRKRGASSPAWRAPTSDRRT